MDPVFAAGCYNCRRIWPLAHCCTRTPGISFQQTPSLSQAWIVAHVQWVSKDEGTSGVDFGVGNSLACCSDGRRYRAALRSWLGSLPQASSSGPHQPSARLLRLGPLRFSRPHRIEEP